MYERLKKLFLSGKLTQEGLRSAIEREWITPEEYVEIISAQETGADE